MNLKDILVHIDNRQTCASRLAVAVQLATQQKARLTGLYVIPQPYTAPHLGDPQQLAAEARVNFIHAVTSAGLDSGWICVESVKSGLPLPHALNLYAHYHDLLVVSQTDADAPDRVIPASLPERAVLGSGRPVLIVPYTGEFKTLGKRVMLAWRGGPESSRALHDALPLLREADSVRVISIQGRGGDETYTAHDADICDHLLRYQLPISSEKLNAGNLSVGDLLLSRCADDGSDLLVMGAFSQTRHGHQTLGEVGSHLLKCMTLPVLMSY
ncbi:universal stress protein [Geopsychrobacter electrodiphilus]|uniref:universal stress protein n=1 Tax=Geopsychrobacter electrodiphilus TaxID=225196 RepID=UPI000376CCE9|nr:universal stress protein [Geopsychrobacter electrodiphilus]